jgi:transposase
MIESQSLSDTVSIEFRQHPFQAHKGSSALVVLLLKTPNRKVALSPWLTQAQDSPIRELRQFAQGIEQDRTSGVAAHFRKESNGKTEGQITKLKFIKRSMNGRCSFALLRRRVLHAA